MKSIILLICLLLSFALSANAELIDNGDGTVTDTITNLMWLQDADYWVTSGDYANAPMGDWIDAIDWAEQLSYAGFNDWRLPSAYNQDGSGPCWGYNCTESELGNLYYTALGNKSIEEPGGGLMNTGPFINIRENVGIWTDTVYWGNDCATPCGWLLHFATGNQLPVFYGTDGEGAWAVRVVPEPISSTLFIVGGATLGFRRFRKKFKI